MPPKTTISKNALEQAAFEVCRAEGAEALTARRLAQALGCSTQPVYTACGSMEQLKNAVAERVKDFTMQRLAEGAGDVPPYLQVGFASLRLAQDEPHLFGLASARMRARLDEPPPPKIAEAMRADPRLAPLSEDQLVRVHSLVWVFAQGLATLLGPDAPEGALSRAESMLRDAGDAIIAHETRTR
ncbi:hypothetical protein WOC76_03860 [Methylocystis sp. IM3]|uniref:hypothetical protein n=1 Tax=unclassified Methylocystis TaxID=2625913 RepID=UPI0030F8E364